MSTNDVKDPGARSGKTILLGIVGFMAGTVLLILLVKALFGI